MSRPYRPSNGSEGEGFMEQFCYRCEHDAAYQANPDGDAQGCKILAATMIFDVDDEGYPKEWIYKDGHPICTAFALVGTYRCPDTPDIFGSGNGTP